MYGRKSVKGAAKLPRRDDLPFVTSSRLRALGVIKDGEASALIEVGGLAREVKLAHRRFPNGGSWSFFLCPACGRRCRILRLYDGKLVCHRCDGLYLRCQWGDGAPDKGPRIARLRALLATDQATVKPDPSGRRARRIHRLETALRRALLAEREARIEKWTKARELAKRSMKRGSKPPSSKPMGA